MSDADREAAHGGKAGEAKEPDVETAETAPPKKKKKKRRAEDPAESPEAPLDDPRVSEMDALFVAGDFAGTRRIANELVASGDARLADRGREYLHRTGVDPVQLAFLGLCAAALITIAWTSCP